MSFGLGLGLALWRTALGGGGEVSSNFNILLESGDDLLIENGDFLVMEAAP